MPAGDGNLLLFVKANRRCLGSGGAAAMALRAACSGLEIKENKHALPQSAYLQSSLKRRDQTPTTAGAAGRAMLAPDALPLPPYAPSARRATRWPTAGARLRNAGLGEVTRASTGWPSARTVVAHTSRRLTPAPRGGGSGKRPRGGGHPPPPRRQRKAPQPGQVTAPEAAEGGKVRRDDERRARLEGFELGGEGMGE